MKERLLRRNTDVRDSPPEAHDERELRFDLEGLDPGDPVEVWFAAEHAWVAGIVREELEGVAWIDFEERDRMRLDEALAGGLKRILH